jgi:carbon-monoxide dehydrogenase small subunit
VKIRVIVNGRARELEIDAHALLLDVLRDGLDLKGAKRSCDMQVCGACTVLVDGLAVSACTYLALEADGRSVLTVEGLADGGALHPLQRAFIDAGAVQCGFCTPGLIVATHDLLNRVDRPGDAEIRESLAGNLCRCTGYEKILDAVRLAAERKAQV